MFYKKLNDLLKKHNITKKKFTDDLGIGKNQLKYWEINQNTPSGDVLIKISDYFKVTPNYLLGYNDKSLSPQQFALIDITNTLSQNDMEKVLEYATLLSNKG